MTITPDQYQTGPFGVPNQLNRRGPDRRVEAAGVAPDSIGEAEVKFEEVPEGALDTMKEPSMSYIYLVDQPSLRGAICDHGTLRGRICLSQRISPNGFAHP